MKRVRVAPGKFVSVSTELWEKAARVFATGLTRDQVRDLKASEPRSTKGLMVGSAKPLALARPKTAGATTVGKISSPAQGPCAAGSADAPAGKN
ncbi:hypothetical protein J2X20_002778 [Pelomonas saccharophila]|uniref:Uncharacterized protein n=1 Tax=Roseateles saccharophilus TaxID=304 RepID=A0ABU1YMP2_ROSSA|nr:hypothetical protein [Roseateles saccharophilus]MDR7270120.1 hypothetical protein [Roseateles saccharophilus]